MNKFIVVISNNILSRLCSRAVQANRRSHENKYLDTLHCKAANTQRDLFTITMYFTYYIIFLV